MMGVSPETRENHREERPRLLKKALRKSDAASRPEQPALQFAYRLLRYRGRSERELRERLSIKGFDEKAVTKVIRTLVSQGFLDDRRLAVSLKRYAEETKHLGVWGMRRFLKERGIPREIIEETVKDIDEAGTAQRVIEKKMTVLGKYPEERMIRKLYGILLRRGYSTETIRKALGSLVLNEDS